LSSAWKIVGIKLKLGFLPEEIKVAISAGRILNLKASTDRNFDFYREKSQSGSSMKRIFFKNKKTIFIF